MIRRDRISIALCALAVPAAVLAIGGAPRWAQAFVAAIAAGAVATTILSKRRFERVPPLLAMIGFAAVWSALQALPMPDALVDALSPTLSALRSDGAELAGVSVSSTLSMDPSATLRSLTFLLTLMGIATVGLRLSVTERGRFLLVGAVGATAALAALIAGLHGLLDLHDLYGIYTPSQLPPVLGPLLNTNHLGCLMAVGAVTNLGLFLYTKQRTRYRIAWAACGLLCLAMTMTTFSRGAVIGLAAGLVVAGAALIAQRMHSLDLEVARSRRRREKFFTTTLPVGVLVACGLVVAVYFGAGNMMQQLQTTSLEEVHAPRTKFSAWRSSFTLVEEAPFVGVGRGAFESAFTRVHAASAYSTFSHAENEAVQAVVEWGVPAFAVLAVLAAWMCLLAIRRWRDGPLAAGAMGALVVVAFQSNFDFGMELLGLAVPVTVLLATLTYVPLTEMASQRLVVPRLARGALVALVAAGGVLLLTPPTRTLAEDHELLRANPRETVRDHIAAHPLDYLGFATLADQRATADPVGGIRLLNHALRLHPTHSGLHWIAARILIRAGNLSQAEAEYSTAVRYSVDSRAIIGELLTALPSDRAARALPLDLNLSGTTRWLVAQKRQTVAMLWLDRRVKMSNDVAAAEELYRLGMKFKQLPLAESAARTRCRILPSTKCKLEYAQVLLAAGKPSDVIDDLVDVADWTGRTDEKIAGWLMLCDAHMATGNVDEARRCLRLLEESGIAQGDQLLEVMRRKEAAGVK